MKKNNKGFMLVEVIITTVVILTSMVGLYTLFNKLYIKYNENNNYYHIDAIYAARSTIEYLLENDFNTYINEIFDRSNYKIIMSSSACNDFEICLGLRATYNTETIIIAEYDKTTLTTEVKKADINETFKDYIDFVGAYYGVSNNDTKYSYIVLTEIRKGNNYYYANLGIE